jgi:hypothetical protein
MDGSEDLALLIFVVSSLEFSRGKVYATHNLNPFPADEDHF